MSRLFTALSKILKKVQPQCRRQITHPPSNPSFCGDAGQDEQDDTYPP